ncbi:MAG: cytochrome d ubiquinol oxidase subunit II [Gemmatimonadota bacterium]|nr:cytochrome d ubiquinol oxidase subunit II [Gemmatimonadota bacterium]
MTLATVMAGVILVALVAYAITGGADFGGGVWDFLATGPRRVAQRKLIADAIAPIWEANHVWLIIVIVLLFSCFPRVFADLSIALHVPVSLMLIGIVLRGSAFIFRAYDSKRDEVQQRWSRIFALASIITPLLLGASIGAVAGGGVTRSLQLLDRGASSMSELVMQIAIRSWLTPFALAVGLLTLASFAWLAAVYLCGEAKDDALRNDFRTRALWTLAILAALMIVTPTLARAQAERLFYELMGQWWSAPYVAITAIAALVAAWALWARHFAIARTAAPAVVALILGGWALAQYPYLIPDRWTIDTAAAPPITLELVLGAVVVGSLLLFPSLFYLMRVFKARG